jgi:HSP20 family protein
MPVIITRSHPVFMETRREINRTITWHVRSSVWCPPTDVYETEDDVIVKVELAGIKDEEIEVAVQDNQLLVSGIRADSSERRAYHQMEILYGKFSVIIELPTPVTTEKAQAQYKDGFLTIQLPKEKSDNQ